MLDLSIIIINYKTPKLTSKCIQTLMDSNDELKWEIIVIDNNSQDDSVSILAKEFPEIKIIANPVNAGFGPANNIAAKSAQGEYLLFLNSDTEVYPDTLGEWFELIKSHKSDISSCKLVNSDGSIQPQGGALPTLMNLTDWMLFLDDLPGINSLVVPYQQRNPNFFRKDQHPGWVGGTALMVKKEVFDTLGGFDDSIFMYGEDVEFCYRATENNYRIDYFSKPQIFHLGQGSGTSQNAILGEYKGLIYLFKKHHPVWKLAIVRLLLKVGALLRVIIFGMIQGDAQKKDIYSKAVALA